MQDRDLYRAILGLSAPWEVLDVELKTDEQKVEVTVGSKSRQWPCPECDVLCSEHDREARSWRHLDTCQFQTILRAEVPRTRCPEHGVLRVRVPWADPGSGFTALFERMVISWLQETGNVSAVARLLGLSWAVVDGIQSRAVRRGLRREAARGRQLPTRLGVDETSFQRRHEYVTVVCDQTSNRVIHVADDRKRESLEALFRDREASDLAAVETVAMDMWPAYIGAVSRWIPGASSKICYDKFHVFQHLGKAVDKVRREEQKAFRKEGEDPLKKTRYLWLTNPDDLDEARYAQIEQLIAIADKTGRAWALKALAQDLWRYKTRGWARKAFDRWYAKAIRSRLEPVKQVAEMLRKHLEGILNAIYHRVTNARSEGINSRIQWLKYSARGFRNRDRFRQTIFFHLGGLDMTPECLLPSRFHCPS